MANVRLTFLGAAGEVTGSCFLVETGEARFLVDCGLFQGGREAERKNFAALDFDVRSLDFVILTHAHLDHCGLLPRLANFGFSGPVFVTPPTADLVPVMLKDSAHIQEKDALAATRVRRGGGRFRRDLAPLYTVMQAEECARLLREVPYDEAFEPHAGVRARFRDAGHILGSAIVELWVGPRDRATKVVFSGDLGQPTRPVVRDPTRIDAADVLVVEGTYGNRLHKSMAATRAELVEAVDETLHRRRGNLVVPAFALGRTQDLLVMLLELAREGRVRPPQVFVDSPLATAATEITLANLDAVDEEARELLSIAGGRRGARPPFPIRFTESAEESKALNSIRSGAMIIAGSGMCDGGRVRHHLRHNLAREECGVLFTGFQAQGTLGRRLVEGAHAVTLFRETVQVRARRYTLGGLSAHADQAALMAWLRAFRQPPRRTFVVHAEPQTAEIFAGRIAEELGWRVDIAAAGGAVRL